MILICSCCHLISCPNSFAIKRAISGAISTLARALSNRDRVLLASISSILNGISFLQIQITSALVYGSLGSRGNPSAGVSVMSFSISR